MKFTNWLAMFWGLILLFCLTGCESRYYVGQKLIIVTGQDPHLKDDRANVFYVEEVKGGWVRLKGNDQFQDPSQLKIVWYEPVKAEKVSE